MDANFLSRIEQCFTHVSNSDQRAKIGSKKFLVSLIFCLTPDSKRKSIAGLRREIAAKVGCLLSRSSFWERLATNKLRRMLVEALTRLIATLSNEVGIKTEVLEVLKVKGIFLLDSCSITLPDNARMQYPAPRNNVVPAAIKWHTCMDLLSGAMRWFSLSPATEHDRQHFPPFDLLKGALVIFDLGYWDYQLLHDLICSGCYFLCRVKANALIQVVGICDNAPQKKLLGKNLMDFNWQRKRENVIEVLGSFCHKGEELFQARVIGFWNPDSRCYHWYTTNLVVAAKLIYPAYRLRWQIELVFKGAKGSLRLEDVPSANSNIIWSLILSSLIANLIAHPLARSLGEQEESSLRKASISFQRASLVLRHVTEELWDYIIHPCRPTIFALKKKLKMFLSELFDPNYIRRTSSLQRVIALG
jgi:hypothetical protein